MIRDKGEERQKGYLGHPKPKPIIPGQPNWFTTNSTINHPINSNELGSSPKQD